MSLITFEQRSKNVRIWSGRRKRPVNVEVDYQRIQNGDFTLYRIASLREPGDHNPPQVLRKAS